MKRFFIALILTAVIITGSQAQIIAPVPTTDPVAALPDDAYIRASRLGITFVSSAQLPASSTRYANALSVGAGWTRWPLYWDIVEPAEGQWAWAEYDRLVTDDIRYELNINAILIGRPSFYADGATMSGINTPVFTDGSDYLEAGKAINPDNKWAVFVYNAVNRYKPGGTLARANGWTGNTGVRVWEIWNEPDLPQFWSGSINQYARLLKVAYLAAKLADPQALVMFGGLLYNSPDNWLARTLAIYSNDPTREYHNWYFDAVGIHNYSYPWRTGWLVRYARQSLIAYNLSRPIWVTETGVSVWNDYPGPTWAAEPEDRQSLATVDQQAWFIIQSAAYAWVEGADVVFYHQLYDDCGDQAAGTDFPPHDGALCTADTRCFGDAYGLFRNPAGNVCYSQHPFPGTPRESAEAYRFLAEVFGTQRFEAGDVTRTESGATIISFDRPQTNERIRVIWNRLFEPLTVSVDAEGRSGQLYTLDRGNTLISPVSGTYQITLGAAQPDSYPYLEPVDRSAIGGPPVVLIERVEGGLDAPPQITLSAITPTPNGETDPLQPTMGPAPLLRPTTDPANDTSPPVTDMTPLNDVSPGTFTVEWSGTDNSGIKSYLVWVKVDGGDWRPWLETSRTTADYTASSGTSVQFAVWAVDLAGNWSTNTDLEPQAVTRVE